MATRDIDVMIKKITKQLDDANFKMMELQTTINEQRSVLEKLKKLKTKYAEADREMEKIVSSTMQKKQKDVMPDAESN